MIAAWMLGSTVFVLLLCVAAFAIERILRITGRPTRAPWVIALVLGVVWPLMAPLVLAPQLRTSARAPLFVSASEVSPAAMIAAQLPSQSAIWEQRAATLLLVVWLVLSAFMLLRLLMAARVLARVTRTAKEVQVDGESVLVTESLGPAVVGLWTPRVAVPQWFLQLDGSLREMVLRHEREHCTSRDPQLVWLASLSVAIMPWNVGMWVLSRRLRLALEIDCDARTLRRESDPTKYSRLLLLIAQRQSSSPLSAMLAEWTSHLSRRITAMQMRPLRKPVLRVVLLTGIAAGAIAVACSPRVASDLTGPGAKPVSATAAKLDAERASGGQVYFESQVERPVAQAPGSPGPIYPADLKAQRIEGTLLAMFVVNEQGLAEVSTLKFLRSSNAAFEASFKDALPRMRFVPAAIGGRPVKQLVQQPFAFALSGAKAGAVSPAVLQTRGASDAKLVAERAAPAARLQTRPDTAATLTTAMLKLDAPALRLVSGKGPAYPSDLMARGTAGSVLVMFVVNRDGSPDMESLKVLKTDDPSFTDAVKAALPGIRYEIPMRDGTAVRQLTQQRFEFQPSNK